MRTTITTFLTAISALGSANGSIIFSDEFNYPDGGIVTNAGGVWVPNTGTVNTMLVSNGMLQVTTSRSEDIAAVLPGGPYRSDGSEPALYTTFKVNFSAVPAVPGTYFAHLTGEQLSFHRGRIWATRTNLTTGAVAAEGNFFLGIGNVTPSSSMSLGPANGQWMNELTTGVTYTIVSRFVIATGTATLWVDPASEADPSVTADDYVDPTNIVNVKYVAFRQASGEGTMLIDALKVGTAFNDVAGANTAPTISAIPNQAAPANSVIGPLAFAIGDAESSPESLQLTTTSSNPALVPETGIAIGGAGANRTVIVTPASGQQGSATIRITVADDANTSFTEFTVKMGTPHISAIANQIATTNTTVPEVSFKIGDAESDPLTLTGHSSNPDLLPDSSIVFGGSGSNRTVTLTPQSGVVGLSTITLYVDDGFTTNSSRFTLTMKPAFGLVFSDDFAYTDFPLQAGSGNHLYLATGSPWTTVSGTAFQVQVTNPLVYLSRTNTEDVGASLPNGPYAPAGTVVFYVGFTVNFSDLPSTSGGYFLHLKASDVDTVSFRAKVFASTANAPENMFRLGVANVANAPVQFPMDLSLGTTYAVVMRYNSGTGETVLWVNPSSEQSPYAAASDNPSTGTIGGIGLREDTGIGNVAIGALKVGTSFSDVFTATTPTEEPLQLAIDNGELVLTWTNPAFSLAEAESVTGPYHKITGAASGYRVQVGAGTKFYRLIYP